MGIDHQAMSWVVALMGGSLAATSFTAKATARAAINTSPEPFSNMGASVLEDLMVPLALWLAWMHPVVFMVLLVLVVLLSVCLIHLCWRFLRAMLARVGRFLGAKPAPQLLTPLPAALDLQKPVEQAVEGVAGLPPPPADAT